MTLGKGRSKNVLLILKQFLSLEFLGLSHRIPGKTKNAVYRLQISALVPEIFMFEKCVKYANETTDDIHSTQKKHQIYK